MAVGARALMGVDVAEINVSKPVVMSDRARSDQSVWRRVGYIAHFPIGMKGGEMESIHWLSRGNAEVFRKRRGTRNAESRDPKSYSSHISRK